MLDASIVQSYVTRYAFSVQSLSRPTLLRSFSRGVDAFDVSILADVLRFSLSVASWESLPDWLNQGICGRH